MSTEPKSLTPAQRIQFGIDPATTIPQLVDAQRQSFAAAGADLSTVKMLAKRHGYDDPDFVAALDRLTANLTAADAKATLAMREAQR